MFDVILSLASLWFVQVLCDGTCLLKAFHSRPELDNKMFDELLLTSTTNVDRLTCISKCSEHASCQLFTYNPSSSTCRLHSESLTTGTAQTGWLYYGIDCRHYVFPHGAGAVPGNLTLDSCVPGYTLLSQLSKGSCYNEGNWSTVEPGCVKFPGPLAWFQVSVVRPIGPGTGISVVAETGTGTNLIYLRGFNGGSPLYILIVQISTSHLSLSHKPKDAKTVPYSKTLTSLFPQNTRVTIRFVFTNGDVGIFVNGAELTRYAMTLDPADTKYIDFGGFNQIFKVGFTGT